MIIYIDEYRQSRAARAAAADRDARLACAGGRPAVARAIAFCCPHAHELSPELPDHLASIDVEAFIDRVYGLASQI